MKKAKGQQIHPAGDTDLTPLFGVIHLQDVYEYYIYSI